MYSSRGIGFISPTLCRLEMGTTCGCIDGDFSSPMKYGTIASRPGMLSNYQTFRLLLILCMNKNCCKPFLRSLNSWRAVRFSFLFCQTQIAKDWCSQSVQTETKGWSSLMVASPLLQPCHISGQHSSFLFVQLSQLRKFPYSFPLPTMNVILHQATLLGSHHGLVFP